MAEVFCRPRAIKGFKSVGKKEQKKIKLAIAALKQGIIDVVDIFIKKSDADYKKKI